MEYSIFKVLMHNTLMLLWVFKYKIIKYTYQYEFTLLTFIIQNSIINIYYEYKIYYFKIKRDIMK